APCRLRTAAPHRRALPGGDRRGAAHRQALRLRTRPHLRQRRAGSRRRRVARGRGAGRARLTGPAVEFDLIARIRDRAGSRADVALGIGDDAAVLQPAPDRQLVVTSDVLNVGVHFDAADAPADIGWKALAVNLSDLAAMGAEAAWCTLALSLPAADARWCEAMLDGFLELADAHGVALVGGDTTRGPLSLCVTAMGQVAPVRLLRRDGARVGDGVWASGTLGDAAAALA